MQLSVLYEVAPINIQGLKGVFGKMHRKQANPGLPVSNKDINDPIGCATPNTSMPERSGNQNTPLKPRHQEFFNAPRDGASLESGATVKGNSKKSQRPVQMRFGDQSIVPQINQDLLSTFSTSPITSFT